MNIITNIENTLSTVHIVWKNYSVIEMEYNSKCWSHIAPFFRLYLEN